MKNVMIYTLPVRTNTARGFRLFWRRLWAERGSQDLRKRCLVHSFLRVAGNLAVPFCVVPLQRAVASYKNYLATNNFMEVQKKKYSKGLKWFVFLSVFFLVVVIGLSSGSNNKQPVAQSEQATSTVADKAQSQEALDALITLSKEAGVISSYEFSETANVVYVTDAWYNLDVSFKKDLLGKIASLKEAATGYHRFEVRNAKSNEKVAEVTAFSGSIEIYK